MGLEALILCMALNIYYEANKEPLLGKIAVAHVTLNRVKETYPSNVCEVVYQPFQFSWTKENIIKPSKQALDNAKEIAELAYKGITTDPTHGATHFHNTSVKPGWKLEKVVQIGNHIFYRE
jgi:spore germination cell wall hydrolase CwlJ-like protein